MNPQEASARVDLDMIIDSVLLEIERIATPVNGQVSKEFRKLGAYWPDGIPPQVVQAPRERGGAKASGKAPEDEFEEDSGFTKQLLPGADVGVTWEALWSGVLNWRNNVEAFKPGTPTSTDDAVKWILNRARRNKKRDNRKGHGHGLASKKKDKGVKVALTGDSSQLVDLQPLPSREEKTRQETADARKELAGHAPDPTASAGNPKLTTVNPEVRGVRVGEASSDVHAPDVDSRASFLAIVRWAESPWSRHRHVFRFDAAQGLVFGRVGRWCARGMDLQSALETIAEETGDHAVRRKWREGMGRAREILYVVGSLGPYGGLRTYGALDQAVEQLDTAFKGAWTGNDLTLLKAVSQVSVRTPGGHGRLTQRALGRLLEGNEASLNAARSVALARLAELANGEALAPAEVVHRSESLVAERSVRPDPLCIRDPRCEAHRPEGGEDQ